MNPGRSMEQCYRHLADTFVTFEGSYADYLTRTAPAWEAKAPADMFWHLVYDVPDQASMARVVALSKQRNARYIYRDRRHALGGRRARIRGPRFRPSRTGTPSSTAVVGPESCLAQPEPTV